MKRYCYLVAILLLAACTGNKSANNKAEGRRSLQSIKWILGNWQNVTPDGTLSEKWKATSDTLWTGEGSVTDTSGNVVFNEQLQLILRNDTIWYVPTVGNQNNGQPVWFMQTILTDTSVVFENLQHDFPQRIAYNKTSDTTLYAYIEGLQDGKMRKEEFSYRRK